MISLPIAKTDIGSYTPHKDFMLLLDEISYFDLNSRECHSNVFVKKESPFFDSIADYVPNWVSFEYMAQSIAALSGLSNHGTHAEPKIGFIMAIREFKPTVKGFKAGQRVDIRVKETFSDNGVVAFDCVAMVDSKTVVSCVINAIEPNDDLMNSLKEG